MEEKFLAALAASREKVEAMGIRIRPIEDLNQARRVLSGTRLSDGFAQLAAKGHLELSLEALAVKKPYTELFTDEEANEALTRLLEAGYSFR